MSLSQQKPNTAHSSLRPPYTKDPVLRGTVPSRASVLALKLSFTESTGSGPAGGAAVGSPGAAAPVGMDLAMARKSSMSL